MRYRTFALAALTALTLLSAHSAQATPCSAMTLGSFTSATVCSVGPLTFKNFSSSLTINQGNGNGDTATVNGSTTGLLSINQGNGNGDTATVISGPSGGNIDISQGFGTGDSATIESGSGSEGNVSPFTSGNEFGFAFPTTPALYSSSITSGTGSVDLDWTFDVIGAPIADAFLAFNTDLITGTNGSAQASVTETINGTPLTLNAPGSTTITFAPLTSFHVDIHETDTQSGSSAVTFDGLTAAFSISTVPEPSTLALLGTGLAGLGLLRRKRK